jgi:glycosyltransferase involved in cell wall biosynthesis
MYKICFLNLAAYSVFYPEKKLPIGGTEVQLFNLAQYLSRKGKVFFVVGDWGQEDVEKKGQVVLYKSTPFNRKVVNYLKAPFLIWRSLLVVDAEVYIASSAGIEIGIVAFFCKIHGKKFIYRTASSIDCSGEFIKKNGFRGKLYKYGLESAHAVVAQNEENQALLKKSHDIDAVVIKNSFVINDMSLGFDDKEFILWVGRTEPNKQPGVFLEIAKKFPYEKFVMIAPKQNHLTEYFEEVSQKAKKIQNVTFIERVPLDQIQEYFSKAKLLVCTSQYEGFPNVHLQACMGKTPIVTLNINPDNYIESNDIGYFCGGDTSVMEKQIRNLLSDRSDWEKKSRNAYEYVKKNHDIDVVGRHWVELIDSLWYY